MALVFDGAFHGSSFSGDEQDETADPGRLAGAMQTLRVEGVFCRGFA